jgi:hypothetical protein
VASDFLGPDELVRLRPRIDVGALERLLAIVPAKARRLVLLACFEEVTKADLRAADLPHSEPGASQIHVEFDDPELRRLWAQVRGLQDPGGGVEPRAT